MIEKLNSDKVSVAFFSRQTGIPKDRVYKWIREGNTPKAEDQLKIIAWITGKKVEEGTQAELDDADGDRVNWHQKYIDSLEKTNQLLEEVIRTNLSGLVQGQQLVVAMLKTSLQTQAEIAAGGDEKKRRELVRKIDKHTADNLGLAQEKGTGVAGGNQHKAN